MAETVTTGSERDGRWPGYLSKVSVIFPELTSLNILLNGWTTSRVLDIITLIFPNVQYLTLDSAGYIQIRTPTSGSYGVRYPELKRLKRLKRVRILWSLPVRSKEWGTVDRPKISEKQMLIETIKQWVRGGLRDLEYVQFIRRRLKESPLEAFARAPHIDEDRLAFSITKGAGREVQLQCRMQFPDWYRPSRRGGLSLYMDLEDVVFEDGEICQYLEELYETSFIA
ncbi:hypothetical protein TWF730_011113 [Orbilia blumenaviensis]|uniref:Uncharacterized protein n=1 Tax=Orbilia blumenaviensis TaxID=1796055 RepID=A0AAV9UJI8_9PEZI